MSLLITKCWHEDLSERPTFEKILSWLEGASSEIESTLEKGVYDLRISMEDIRKTGVDSVAQTRRASIDRIQLAKMRKGMKGFSGEHAFPAASMSASFDPRAKTKTRSQKVRPTAVLPQSAVGRTPTAPDKLKSHGSRKIELDKVDEQKEKKEEQKETEEEQKEKVELIDLEDEDGDGDGGAKVTPLPLESVKDGGIPREAEPVEKGDEKVEQKKEEEKKGKGKGKNTEAKGVTQDAKKKADEDKEKTKAKTKTKVKAKKKKKKGKKKK